MGKKELDNKQEIKVTIAILVTIIAIAVIAMTIGGTRKTDSSYFKSSSDNTSGSSYHYSEGSSGSYKGSNSNYSGGSSSSYKGSNSNYSGGSSSSYKKSNSSSSYKSSNPADYDSKGNYKPVETMTQKEIRDELEEIVKDNWYKK